MSEAQSVGAPRGRSVEAVAQVGAEETAMWEKSV
jgi:hypothetical protein